MYSINVTMTFLTTLLFSTVALGHMEMSDPPPFRSKFNKLVLAAAPGSVDYSMTAPIASGNAAPLCKGYQTDLGSPAGASVATWAQGSTQSYTVAGSAVHGGGSCQVSLSYDGGKTFTAIHSFIGSCPMKDGETFSFTVPTDAPTGAAVFGWTWFNEVGNREIYMNCASITISAGSGTRAASSVAFSARPGIFLANLGNGCTSVEGTDIVFPNPGPDVTNNPKARTGSGTGFTGTCGAVANSGSGSGSGSSAVPAPVASSVAPSPISSATSSPTISIVPVYSSTNAPSTFITSTQSGIFPTSTGTASQPASTGTTGGGLTLSVDGECGGTQTCGTNCCSQYGYCGSSEAFCGTGCMAAFGRCDSAPVSNGTVSRRWQRRI